MRSLRNVINLDDARWAARGVRKLPTVARRLGSSDRVRTVEEFSKDRPPDQWWDVPAVTRRWNQLVTGDPSVDHYRYVAEHHLDGSGHTGLSVGCGEGHRERAWARTGRFGQLTGIDLTPRSIERARAAAADEGLDDVLDYRVWDLADGPPPGVRPDVLIGEHALHHVSPLREVLVGLRDLMPVGGLFVIDEYVGPTKQQWSPEQLRCANSVLQLLPERLRTDVEGRVRTRVGRPSLLYMRLRDPSEAIESARILPLMSELFEPLEVRPYGGTILHIVLAGIAHNFRDEDDAEAAHWLHTMMELEDGLLRDGRLVSDFAVAVYRKR